MAKRRGGSARRFVSLGQRVADGGEDPSFDTTLEQRSTRSPHQNKEERRPKNATHPLAPAPALEVALMVVLAHLVNELLLATMLSLIIVSRV